MRVAEDVRTVDQIVIPKATEAVGELARAEAKGAFGASGKLEVHMLYIVLNGRPVRLSGVVGARGRNGTAGTVAVAIAAGTLAFVVTGKRAEIAAGTRVYAYLDRDLQIPDRVSR